MISSVYGVNKLMMPWKIWIVVLLILEICGHVISATACTAEMIACTRQMTNDMAAISNKTLLCGILEKYMHCIEYSCMESLTQCELNKARSVLADLLTDYSFRCAMYIPRYGDDCNAPPPASSSASSLLCASSVMYTCYLLSFKLYTWSVV